MSSIDCGCGFPLWLRCEVKWCVRGEKVRKREKEKKRKREKEKKRKREKEKRNIKKEEKTI
jgi:hypothetical protein